MKAFYYPTACEFGETMRKEQGIPSRFGSKVRGGYATFSLDLYARAGNPRHNIAAQTLASPFTSAISTVDISDV